MTDQTIKENELIAKFMNNMHEGNVIHEPLYDISWDWLMPVVEKINAYATGQGYFSVRIEPTETSIYDTEYLKVIDVVSGDMLSNTFVAVVEFIKRLDEWT